jgi:uncharacterized protein YndB with AHSA1/START domain
MEAIAMKMRGTASRYVAAPPDVVFGVVTDVERLPEWNQRMTGVVEVPEELRAGAEWVVGFRIGGSRFNSRSVAMEVDAHRRRFVHRSKPDDDNPSFTLWTWEVEPEGAGSRVMLSWHFQPATLLRKAVLSPIRAWQMPRHDAPDSLAALARVCEADPSRRDADR